MLVDIKEPKGSMKSLFSSNDIHLRNFYFKTYVQMGTCLTWVQVCTTWVCDRYGIMNSLRSLTGGNIVFTWRHGDHYEIHIR